jgi:hypothetical protein
VKTYDNSKLCNDTWEKINELAGDLNWYDLFRKTYPESMLLKSVNRLGTTIIGGEER